MSYNFHYNQAGDLTQITDDAGNTAQPVGLWNCFINCIRPSQERT